MPTVNALAMPLESQQLTASSNERLANNKIPGSMAVWIFIYAELFEFGLFFIGFLMAKIYYPNEFYQGPSQLSTTTGLLNTLVLLTSSFFVVRAMKAIKRGEQKQTVMWLFFTILAGLTYCAIKTWEYNLNDSIGVTPRTNCQLLLHNIQPFTSCSDWHLHYRLCRYFNGVRLLHQRQSRRIRKCRKLLAYD